MSKVLFCCLIVLTSVGICGIVIAMAGAFDIVGSKTFLSCDLDCDVDQHFDLDMVNVNMTIINGFPVRLSCGCASRRSASPSRVKTVKQPWFSMPANLATSHSKSEIAAGQNNSEKNHEACNEALATPELKACDAHDIFLHLPDIRTPPKKYLIALASTSIGHFRLSLGVETGNMLSMDDSQSMTGTSHPHEFPSNLVSGAVASFVLFYATILTLKQLVQSFEMVWVMILAACGTITLLLDAVLKFDCRKRNDASIFSKSITNYWRGLCF
jgi:hypothetical protein